MDFLRESVIPKDAKNCPFCPGNEAKTPPEVLVYGRNGGSPNTSGWSIRVVPNKFPALEIEGGLDREAEGIYDRMNGTGAHEVIIESPEHQDTYATMGEKRGELFAAIQKACGYTLHPGRLDDALAMLGV